MDPALSDKAALEGMSIDTLRRFMRSCLDITSCPVCLETLSPETVQCVNDHLLCQGCKSGLSECPTCRGPFCETKPSRFVLQLIEALPKVCKYKNCGRFLEPEDNHELYCCFRETECKCCWKWSGPVRYLVDHVHSECETPYILQAPSDEIVNDEFDPLKEFDIFSLFIFDEYLFWEEIVNNPDDKTFYITYHFEPNGKPEENIYLEIRFVSDKSKYISKMKLNLDPEQSVEYNTFHVPWHTLPDYMEEDERLFRSYTFSKEAV